jgi:glucosamine--fructose-6-phosphate aminotransferase (isomerizing)
MCGIIGACAERNVTPILLEGLKRLEYRGYDSAGVAVIDNQNELQRRRVLGKVQNLINLIEKQPLQGTVGIGHTRWATHGAPNETNAHPHISNRSISLAHNGIIENFEPIRHELIEKGYQFTSETDTEAAVHLLHHYLQEEKNFLHVLLKLAQVLQGAYALAIIDTEIPQQIWAIRKGSPLVIGLGIHENFLASDQLALLPVTNEFIYLHEGDIACLTQTSVQIWDQMGNAVQRNITTASITLNATTKGDFRHFMLKEIFEQQQTALNLIEHTFEQQRFKTDAFISTTDQLLKQAKQIYIIACGTSYHAGLVAKYWLEHMTQTPCQVEIASEFRYRSPVAAPGTLLITISQSGETADTLAALRLAKQMNFIGCLAICNVPGSSLARESDALISTQAGPEIGVASTKAFTNQLLALLTVVVRLAEQKGEIINESLAAIFSLPTYINEVLSLDEQIKKLAQQFIHTKNTLFLGRGTLFPIAAEGALKLKELSYIHAEAYPAGELKHGPLALVDRNMPIVLLAPKNKLLEKIYSNAQEIKAREGRLFILTDEPLRFAHLGETLTLPSIPEIIAPIIYSIPLQLFAYHVAVLKGTDVDQPRNLAKSVTVE